MKPTFREHVPTLIQNGLVPTARRSLPVSRYVLVLLLAGPLGCYRAGQNGTSDDPVERPTASEVGQETETVFESDDGTSSEPTDSASDSATMETDSAPDSATTETDSASEGCLEGPIEIDSQEQVAALEAVDCIDGNLSIAWAQEDLEVHLPKLTAISGDLTIWNNSATTNVSMENLTRLDGLSVVDNLYITLDLSALPKTGSINLDGQTTGGSVAVDLGALVQIDSLTTSNNMEDEMTIGFEALDTIDGDVVIFGALTALPLGALQTLSGMLLINMSTVERLDLGSLIHAEMINIVANPELAEVALGNLEVVTGGLTIAGNPMLESLRLGSLVTVEGTLAIAENPALGALDLGALEEVSDSLVVADNDLLACDAEAVIGRVTASETLFCGNAPDGGCGADECPL